MNLQDIKKRILAKQPVTAQEIAWAATQDKYVLFNTLLDNNLADVNYALRINLKNKFLPFVPDRKAIEGVLSSYIEKGDHASLQTVLDEFDFNPNANNYTTNQEFLQHLKKNF